MLVKDCMTRHPIMISADTAAAEAQKVMSENNIRHLPVVGDGKRLKGLVTRSSFSVAADELGSLDVWEISRRLSNLKVKNVMIPKDKVYTIDVDRPAERASRVLTENKIGCLPVLEDDVVVGIVTTSDVMRAFQEMLGLPSDGVRVTMRMPNQPGEFSKLMTALAAEKWGIMGIGSFPSRRQEGMYDAVVKIPGVSKADVERVLSQIDSQEIIDMRVWV